MEQLLERLKHQELDPGMTHPLMLLRRAPQKNSDDLRMTGWQLWHLTSWWLNSHIWEVIQIAKCVSAIWWLALVCFRHAPKNAMASDLIRQKVVHVIFALWHSLKSIPLTHPLLTETCEWENEVSSHAPRRWKRQKKWSWLLKLLSWSTSQWQASEGPPIIAEDLPYTVDGINPAWNPMKHGMFST